ncbi:MAG: Do family serine endopeptidase [Hyphomicrobiales bacterium]|nr:Do family serine endopeptidase [Hyphomicrobiales bacterium]MDE2113769.1 Do family serine endopeptidase [Hyphomicrobiales bacterium]
MHGPAGAQALATPSAQGAQFREVPASAGAILSFAPVVKKALPAVVNVFASHTDKSPPNPLLDDPFFRRFFGNSISPQARTEQSLGSGVIVDPSGLVVTNYHVIEGMTEVKVALSDKREFPAQIVLRDKRTDLAVLKLDSKGPFPTAQLGESDDLQVGDLVLAIGNPFGVGQTVTQGIVSALARTQVGVSDYGFFIQTDAAINPGNSGGAMVDMNARVVGINSAIYTQTGSSVGIGFAIPIDTVKAVIAAARNGGHAVQRPWLGATLQNVTPDIANSLGLDHPVGALISDVAAGGPAALAGLHRGDVIVALNDKPVDDMEALGYRFGTLPLGGQARVRALRDGKPMPFLVTLKAPPEIPALDARALVGPSPFRGAKVGNISPAVIEELSLQGVTSGVVVLDVAENSTAAQFSLQKGDVVVEINGKKISDSAQMAALTNEPHSYWKLTINRNGQVFTSVIGG